MQVTEKQKTWLRRGAAALAIAWALALSVCVVRSPGAPARGFSSGGNGMILGGGGISRVVTNSPGLLAGSGTVANPLTATITQGSGLSGTGSSGSPLATDVGSGLTYSSGALITNVGTGLGYSAGAVVANLAGGTCTNDQGVTSLSSSGTATCGTVGRNAYGGTHFEWSDDFVHGGTNTVTASTSLWGNGIFALNQNGTASTSGGTGTTTRPGFAEQSVTTTTARTALFTSGSLIDFNSIATATFEAVIGWPTLSDTGTPTDAYAQVIGFADTANSVDIVDGCYFLYDTQNVATSGPNSGKVQKLSCWCVQNSNRAASVFLMDGSTVSDESFTTVDAPVAALTLPSTNIYHLKVTVTGTTRAEFYVNGVKSCDITHNIPSGSTRLTGAVIGLYKNTGNTNARVADTDWARISLDYNSARSP